MEKKSRRGGPGRGRRGEKERRKNERWGGKKEE